MSARILVVDDIAPNVKLLEAKLSAEYFEVITARDGPSALEIARLQSPDLILLDVMMPGMDGFEVCEQLKSNPATRHIPVVMVTALSDVSDRVRGLEAGADDFLSKPVNDLALFSRVKSLVRLKTMVDELRLRQAISDAEEVFDPQAYGAPKDGANAKVLVVDSNDFAAGKIVSFLEEAGHSADRAKTLADGFSLGSQETYDLAIAALDIGGEDGLRLCSQFRSNEITRQLPFLLVLDDVDLPKLAKGLDLGVTDYLIRPVDRNELLARTRTQIRQSRYHEMLRGMLTSSVSMAFTDALTGLYNRRYMSTNLDRKIMEIAESSKPISVILFDIDHFKLVNDTYGHNSGDEVLRELAGRIGTNLRGADFAARYGGEEFAVVMSNTATESANMVAERLRCLVAETPFRISGHPEPLTVTISLGVATTTDPIEEASELLQRADVSLYEAKKNGRNQVGSMMKLVPEADENATPAPAAAVVG